MGASDRSRAKAAILSPAPVVSLSVSNTILRWNGRGPRPSVKMLTESSRIPNFRASQASITFRDGMRSKTASESLEYPLSARAGHAVPHRHSIGRQVAHDSEEGEATAGIAAQVNDQAITPFQSGYSFIDLLAMSMPTAPGNLVTFNQPIWPSRREIITSPPGEGCVTPSAHCAGSQY